MGFHMKIPLYQRFHTFFGPFHTFFSHLQISNMDHNNHLNNCYKTILGLHGFSYENSSISTISHLFCRFNTFFHTFFKNIFSLYNPPTWMLKEYIFILWVLHSKFLYNYGFTPFPINFTPFFTPFSKNIFKI